MITSFSGAWAPLSNFYPCLLFFEGHAYPTVEHAYQAAKSLDDNVRSAIRHAPTPGLARKYGQLVALRSDWSTYKLVVMRELLEQKFQDERFARTLRRTGTSVLVEGNWWGDTFWGQCPVGEGLNQLGQMLMEIRGGLK